MKAVKKLEKNNTRDCLWPYILRILKDGPLHAYVLREEIRKRYGFTPGNVTAYRVLYSLKNDGLVKENVSGRKRVYTISRRGLDALNRCIVFYRGRVRLLS
jgi:DNA-binding PadR family transcriptional regulator